MYGYNEEHYRDTTAWEAFNRMKKKNMKNALKSLVSVPIIKYDKFI